MRKYVTLGDVCKKGSSNIAQKDIENSNGTYAIYGASGYIKDVNFYHQDKPYIAVVKDGAGIGRTMLLPEKTSVIGTLQYLIPNDSISVKYLYYAVTYMNLSKYFTGATIPHIYFKDYQKELLPLPPMEKQLEIARNLEKIDAMIGLCNSIVEKMDVLVKSRFIEMFGDPLQPAKSKPLGDMALLERGKFSPRPRNDPQYYNGVYPFVQTGDVANCNHRLVSYHQTLNEKGIKVSKCFPSGTILIALVGATIGATAILEIDAYTPDSLIGITPRPNICNNVFLEVLLQFWQPELKRIAPEAARANINLGILENVPIIDADFSIQEDFATFVREIDKSKLAVKECLEKAEYLKSALMQEYFG